MKKSTFLVFVTYVWLKTLLGLVIHPYKEVREVTRHHILFPVVLSPLYGLAALFVAGRIGSFLFETQGLVREVMALILSAGLISILLWQLLLLYLLTSFLLAFQRD